MAASAVATKTDERPRIALDAQFAMLSVIIAYVVAMALVGGAELARYMLPVVPLVILIGVSTLWRRVGWWRGVIAIMALMFVAGWFVNPPYGFAPEDNLAYRDYIRLHQNAEEFLEARYPMARVLTAWPASDELKRPYLGYVTRPMRVVRIEHFAARTTDGGGRSRVRIMMWRWCSPPSTSPPIRCWIMAFVAGLEGPFFRLPSRLAAGGRRSDSGWKPGLHRNPQRTVDRRNRDGSDHRRSLDSCVA